jgi:hypothetical protein
LKLTLILGIAFITFACTVAKSIPAWYVEAMSLSSCSMNTASLGAVSSFLVS